MSTTAVARRKKYRRDHELISIRSTIIEEVDTGSITKLKDRIRLDLYETFSFLISLLIVKKKIKKKRNNPIKY